MMTLQQALDWIPSARLVGDGTVMLARVHSDTRSLKQGDLFVALRGEHFDAHDFLPRAKAEGALAAIAQHGLLEAGLPGVEVADTRVALGHLATGWRSQFSLPLIAVTGSNGKTTVTQMIAAILRAWSPAGAFATEGNFNNDVGVPLTLLRLRPSHQAGVVELGMNHAGEIAHLAAMTRPTVALVNNAQREHLEFMETVQAVALENGSVLASLNVDGVAVFPADDDYTALWRRLAGGRQMLTFALSGPADVTASWSWNGEGWHIVAKTPAGPLEFSLQIAGRHNVKNALAATACAIAAGIGLPAIAAGLSSFAPVKGRSRAISIKLHGRKLTLIDDTYNANPDSMQAAIEVLAELPGPRLLVMGDMGEVGDQGARFHAEAGRQALALGIEQLFTLGVQTREATAAFGQGRHFADMAELQDAVVAELPRTASILVKGSRFMMMEQVIHAVTDATDPQRKCREKVPHAA